MPIPLAAIGLGLQGAGGVASFFEGKKARKEAKKQNREQRKLDALMNLISVAGGGGPTGFSPLAAVPSGGVGNALSSLGDLASAGGQLQRQTISDDAAVTKAADDLKTAKANRDLKRAQTKFENERDRSRGSSSTNRLPTEFDRFRVR